MRDELGTAHRCTPACQLSGGLPSKLRESWGGRDGHVDGDGRVGYHFRLGKPTHMARGIICSLCWLIPTTVKRSADAVNQASGSLVWPDRLYLAGEGAPWGTVSSFITIFITKFGFEFPSLLSPCTR